MPKKRSWTNEQLKVAVINSKSYRAVLVSLGLIPAGGNYEQVKNAIRLLSLDTSHFLGMGWNKGQRYTLSSTAPVEAHLVSPSYIQSFKLKKKLFASGYKEPRCELCGWKQLSPDGRVPVELDHINGDRHDNRLGNLRILCPNCHSLQPTHRGKNKKVGLHKLTK